MPGLCNYLPQIIIKNNQKCCDSTLYYFKIAIFITIILAKLSKIHMFSYNQFCGYITRILDLCGLFVHDCS